MHCYLTKSIPSIANNKYLLNSKGSILKGGKTVFLKVSDIFLVTEKYCIYFLVGKESLI